MALYSYKGAEPTELPTRLRIAPEDAPSGATETRTRLDELSDDELKDLKFIRVDLTEYDNTKYYREWDSEFCKYDFLELDNQEKIARQYTPQPDPVADWVAFEEKFSSLEINKKLYESGDPFLVQIISQTKLMITYMRCGVKIQNSLGAPNLQQGIDILSVIEENGVTQNDRDQFIADMKLTNLDAEINIPTDEWMEHHWYENTGDIFTCIKADSHNIGGE